MSAELQSILRTIMLMMPQNADVSFQQHGTKGVVTICIDPLSHVFVFGGHYGVTLTTTSSEVFECHIEPVSTDGSGVIQHKTHFLFKQFIDTHSVETFFEEYKTCMGLALVGLPKMTEAVLTTPQAATEVGEDTKGWEDLFWNAARVGES